MDESSSVDRTLDILKVLPFMEAFPFEEYQISLELEGTDPSELGVSPILIDALGTFGTDLNVHFFYVENDSKILIAINAEDVLYVSHVSDKITTLDTVLSDLNYGMQSPVLEDKITKIKQGKKFVKKLNNFNLLDPPFSEVLQEMLNLEEVVLTSNQMTGLNKLNVQKILDKPLTDTEKRTIFTYLNFQLHYIKILLGVVIATKIY
jgi:hypothetical protein